MIWPLLTVFGLLAAALIWHQRPRRAQMAAVVVTAVALTYAWVNLGKG